MRRKSGFASMNSYGRGAQRPGGRPVRDPMPDRGKAPKNPRYLVASGAVASDFRRVPTCVKIAMATFVALCLILGALR